PGLNSKVPSRAGPPTGRRKRVDCFTSAPSLSKPFSRCDHISRNRYAAATATSPVRCSVDAGDAAATSLPPCRLRCFYAAIAASTPLLSRLLCYPPQKI
ncbi:hypothetical protein U1Q18_023642, partial [Sarracenia purpurea var. burkii]